MIALLLVTVADSVLFLSLAGLGVTGPALAGQLVVKAVTPSLTGLVIAEVVRRAVPRQRQLPTGA